MAALQSALHPEDAVIATPFPEAVSELVRLLGMRVTAVMLGADQSRTVRRWMDGSTTPQDDRVREKATFALLLTAIIRENSSADAVYSWMVCVNFRLRDRAPVMLIREAFETQQLNILSAARSYMTNQG